MPTGHYERKPWGRRVVLICEWCKEPFELLESVLRARRRAGGAVRFCSQACMGAAAQKPDRLVELTCPQCGIAFPKRVDHLLDTNYCSRACASASRRVDGAKWRDPEHIRAYMREYTQKNKEINNERARRWNKTHRSQKAAIRHKRRARLKAGNFTADQWDRLKATYNYICLCCGRCEPDIQLTPDHIIPLSRNGDNTINNIQPLCFSCNSRKGVKTIDYRPSDTA